ncbi:MAG: metallophosphoesterase [Lachnospiraceae bacterium]|jgi:predicted MPP superfamily phosphohydrolase|nr:metallophosphoesterase [Lachnospiraceae bacterium]
MAALLLAPIYLIINFYVLRWTLHWMGACHRCFKSRYFRIGFVVLFFLISTTPLSAFLIKAEPLHRFLKVVSNVWFGVFLYAILCIAAVDLIRLIVKCAKLLKKEIYESRRLLVVCGIFTVTAVISLSAYGIVHARHLYTTSYEVKVDKPGGDRASMKVVLAADLHLGYSIGEWSMKNMVEKINAEDPDLVVLAGDVFDNEFSAVKNPGKIAGILKSIKSTYGVYACYGNHDLDEPILAGFTFSSQEKENDDSRMTHFFEEAGITLLQDEAVLIDNLFYLAGRKDYSRAKKVDNGRLTPAELLGSLDQTKPIFVIDHQPRDYQALDEAGADIDFSGHTHDGQLFPGNLVTALIWDNSYGYQKEGGLHTFVTSGVGVWGPNMRVCTKSEIASVTVKFSAAD